MRILGFDARERWCPRERLWPAERAARFLLRDTEKPLSTDVMVWPSVFEDPQLDLLGMDDLSLGSAGASAPAFRGFVQDLWQDLDALERALTPVTAGRYDVIAVSVDGEWHPSTPPCVPADLDAQWLHLGFDVSDSWLLSGLSNCGYAQEEIDAMRAQWGPRLNAHHLFDDRLDASAFATLCGERVREHAPFHVYGLWRRQRGSA